MDSGSLHTALDKMNLEDDLKASMMEKISQVQPAKLSVEDFELQRVIGRGSFGEVRLCRQKKTGKVYAIKVLQKTDVLKRNQVEQAMAERDVLALAANPWVVKLHHSFQDDLYLYLVLEFLQGGDLMSLLLKHEVLTESQTRFYIAEVASAIASVHQMKYVHRDLKPDNIILDRYGHIKLTDFGLCNGIDQPSPRLTQFRYEAKKDLAGEDVLPANAPLPAEWKARARSMMSCTLGTPDYIAPEVLTTTGPSGPECDWWSLGVIMYECLVGTPPFFSVDPLQTCHKIINWRRTLNFPSFLSVQAKDLMQRLLCAIEDRLTFVDLKLHPFFKGIDWNLLRMSEPPFVPVVVNDYDTRNFDLFNETKLNPEHLLNKGPKFPGFSFTRAKSLDSATLPFGFFDEPSPRSDSSSSSKSSRGSSPTASPRRSTLASIPEASKMADSLIPETFVLPSLARSFSNPKTPPRPPRIDQEHDQHDEKVPEQQQQQPQQIGEEETDSSTTATTNEPSTPSENGYLASPDSMSSPSRISAFDFNSHTPSSKNNNNNNNKSAASTPTAVGTGLKAEKQGLSVSIPGSRTSKISPHPSPRLSLTGGVGTRGPGLSKVLLHGSLSKSPTSKPLPSPDGQSVVSPRAKKSTPASSPRPPLSPSPRKPRPPPSPSASSKSSSSSHSDNSVGKGNANTNTHPTTSLTQQPTSMSILTSVSSSNNTSSPSNSNTFRHTPLIPSPHISPLPSVSISCSYPPSTTPTLSTSSSLSSLSSTLSEKFKRRGSDKRNEGLLFSDEDKSNKGEKDKDDSKKGNKGEKDKDDSKKGNKEKQEKEKDDSKKGMKETSVDPVSFAAYAPAEVSPSASFSLFVWAFLAEQAVEVERLAAETESKQKVGQEEGILLARETRVTVQLIVPSQSFLFESSSSSPSALASSAQSFVWRGAIDHSQFRLRCQASAPVGPTNGQVYIYVEGAVIAIMAFTVQVVPEAVTSYPYTEEQGATSETKPAKPSVDTAELSALLQKALTAPRACPCTVRYIRTIFACYCDKDKEWLEKYRTKLLRAMPKLSFFMDVVTARKQSNSWQDNLSKGQVWKGYDLLQVFFSKSAETDVWVKREVESAHRARGAEFFQVVRLPLQQAAKLTGLLQSIVATIPDTAEEPSNTPLLQSSDFTLLQPVGKGNFGEAYLAKWAIQEAPVVVKRVPIRQASQEDLMGLVMEAAFSKRLSENSHVVKFLGATVHTTSVGESELWIVSEFMSNGSLKEFLKQPGDFNFKDRLLLCLGAAKGVAQLHACGVLHRDISARNFLVDVARTVKISDFGMSAFCRHQFQCTVDRQVPIKWMAPEAISVQLWSTASDVWSLGVTVWEILSGVEPFADLTNVDAANAIVNGGTPITHAPALNLHADDIQPLLTKCWAADPHDRMTALDLYRELQSLSDRAM